MIKRFIAAPILLSAFLLAVAPVRADVAAPPASLVVITDGAPDSPAQLAVRQMQTWPLRGAAIQPLTVEAFADADAKPAFVVMLAGDDAKEATYRVTYSPAAKALAERFAADLKSAMPAMAIKPADVTIDGATSHPVIERAARANVPAIVVTVPATKTTSISQQSRILRLATAAALREMNAYDGTVDALLPAREPGKLNVAVYDGLGSNRSPGPKAMSEILSGMDDVRFARIGPAEVTSETLRQFDVVMFPGGRSITQGKTLGEAGRQAVKAFVDNGGGYIGNCAGAHVATSGYDWSFHLINLVHKDPKHWNRGTGNMQVELTDDGRKMFGDYGTVTIRYANGPIFLPADIVDMPRPTVLAYYRTEIAKNGSTAGDMIDTPAIVASPYGKGRVIAFSCHPEYSKDYKGFIVNAVKWVTEKD